MTTCSDHALYGYVWYLVVTFGFIRGLAQSQQRRTEIEKSLLLLVAVMPRSGRCGACKVRKIKVCTPSHRTLLLPFWVMMVD